MADSFTPPDGVRSAARRGLELRRRFDRGGAVAAKASSAGVGNGVQRATSLSNGEPISAATAKRMGDFFKRNAGSFELDKREDDGGPTAATITWMLWGGDAGRDWVNSLGDRTEKADEDSSVGIEVKVEKVDQALGIVFGYAIVCKVDGEDYYDTQGDHIPETSMLDATADFMAGDRMAKVMHRGESAGQVVYGFPVTEDIAKALGFEVRKTGFVVGMRPDDEEVLAKYASGEYTGFSIGGRRIEEEVVA
jgi:hypothetical protein